MIITSVEKLEIGKIYSQKELECPFETPEGNYEKYKFLVIRETTLEEYRKYLEETYSQIIVNQIINYEYFYEVHSD